MPYLTANDTELFYRDWGTGRPVVFVASWGLSSDMWRFQMPYLTDNGVRAIAYDRRGQGRSDNPGRGYDFDTLADDLGALLDHLDLTGTTLIGHSMGGGEIVRYLTRHGAGRVEKIVLIGSTVPCLMRKADNANGIDPALLEATVDAVRDDLGQWLIDNAPPFFGDGVPGCELPQVIKDWTLQDLMKMSADAGVALTRTNIATDFRAELPGIALPALILHGEYDASAPVDLCARVSAQLLPNARLEIYPNAAHALHLTHRERLNADLLGFVRESAPAAV
ncbi:MAG TPA: alpha/beta hydrolase [Pseudonocardia sp.]|jgi:pimeloyl-ACP methyl ester carboxylesterase|nr:alpha/beta hydrolase [Pseudonocardia sp.]